MAITAAEVWRDYETDGVPSSGSHKVKKSDTRSWGAWVEGIITAFTANGGLIYSSKAAMDADLAHGANSSAWVIGDATVANNGIYRKIGASGAGSWTRVADLPFSFIIASDAGAGTANAIQATTSIPVSGSALVWMNIFEANTASPVTVSFNGGAALTIKTNSGSDVAAGGLTAGMIVMGIVSGSTFRLVSDQASAAVVAAAEAAKTVAEASRLWANMWAEQSTGSAVSSNLYLRSQEIDNASWTKTNATVTANAVAAPDGTTTADKLVETTTASVEHSIRQTAAISVSASTQYTRSGWFKAAERNLVRLRFATNIGFVTDAYFDVATGVIRDTAGVSLGAEVVEASRRAKITYWGNGWYRCELTATTQAGATIMSGGEFYPLQGTTVGVVSYTGDGVSGVYAWGLQFEQAPFASVYTPTTSAAVSMYSAKHYAAAAEGVGVAVAVWPSGTLRTMKARATDTYCILDAPGSADPTGVNDSTSAFEAMIAGGVKCEVTAGSFLLTRKLVVPDGVELVGQGRGYEFAHKTKLLFAGTGTKEHAIAGATATTVANPDAGAPYLADSGTRGNNYSTLDLTPNFSAAVILGKASGLKGLGIYPNFNGVAGYSGSDGALSDNWDVGVWARNADWWNIEDCNVIGHWRKAALLISAHEIGDGKVPSCELGHAIRSHFQGFRGVAIRTAETVVGDNYGFAGTDFVNCLIKSLWHQSKHLATSSFLSTPFSSPSGCMEIAGDIMRGVQFLNCTFMGRDDIAIFFGKCSEIKFEGCYEEGKSINVNGAWLANSDAMRMVAISDAGAIDFGLNNSKYVVDFAPAQTRDSSLAGKRYTAAGAFNPAHHFDGDYSRRIFASYIGYRMRKSTDQYRFEDENGVGQVAIDAAGKVQANLLFAGTITIADDAAVSITTPKNGGQCVITCCGSTENGNFPDPLRSGTVFYDVGTATLSATKFSAAGTNFLAVNTDVTGTTGTDGNVTVGVVAGNIRIENRAGSSQVFRYAFLG
ncbi:hypothetical protein QN219_04850 [Sinorhizobium sp. 7-81]|uniref:phage head spike fiber domain-containing protein n=1 Tax=Sinorhizobium sp. 8-89 TaxID=3049089 RepID=UPI0024C268F9|nr:hypothetical protein [Sinorhizobium sp. 8-89]MDK1489385.1 hypothetical protein [Sinorhizobium sp. 8-89]